MAKEYVDALLETVGYVPVTPDQSTCFPETSNCPGVVVQMLS